VTTKVFVFGVRIGLKVAKMDKLGEVGCIKERIPMDETNRIENEKSQLRASLQTAIDKAQEVCQRLQDQTTAAAKATDRTIRENPYQAVGVAFGLGLLVGVLIARSRGD